MMPSHHDCRYVRQRIQVTETDPAGKSRIEPEIADDRIGREVKSVRRDAGLYPARIRGERFVVMATGAKACGPRASRRTAGRAAAPSGQQHGRGRREPASQAAKPPLRMPTTVPHETPPTQGALSLLCTSSSHAKTRRHTAVSPASGRPAPPGQPPVNLTLRPVLLRSRRLPATSPPERARHKRSSSRTPPRPGPDSLRTPDTGGILTSPITAGPITAGQVIRLAPALFVHASQVLDGFEEPAT